MGIFTYPALIDEDLFLKANKLKKTDWLPIYLQYGHLAIFAKNIFVKIPYFRPV